MRPGDCRGPAGRAPRDQARLHLNKRHWITVTVDGSLPDEMVHELVQDSFDVVVD